MYVLSWDDHTGQHHEMEFEDQEDAIEEAWSLANRDDVEYVYPVEERQ